MSRCSKCCEDFNINPLHLVMPHLMGPDGRAFVDAHGIDVETLAELREGAILMDSGEVKIKHRCEKLTDDGLCSIYDARPQICRDFDCKLKTECTMPVGAIALTPVDVTETAFHRYEAATGSVSASPEDDE
jgi:Fe-S-cluster containining protein